MVGTTISHYTITEKIGRSGMGEVYRATDTKLNRDVGLKVLPEAFAQDQQRMARFSREVQVLASVNHPNIATFHGLEEADGKRALVLEWVEGGTLKYVGRCNHGAQGTWVRDCEPWRSIEESPTGPVTRSRRRIRMGKLVVVALVLTATLSCASDATLPAGPEDLYITPYLQNVTPTSITVMWETRKPVVGSVEYGLSRKFDQMFQ